MQLNIRLHVLLLVSLVGSVLSSSGDRAEQFQTCVAVCQSRSCRQGMYALPLALRLTRWTCIDDCKYKCMHMLTDQAVEARTKIHQYYGKWPFWRFAGMQEPASVAFSLLNLLAHVRGYRLVQRKVPEGHPLKGYYKTFALVSMNAWVWSSVFHTRDLPITEKLDYFSAALAILYALYCTTIRLFHIYPSERVGPVQQPRQAHWSSSIRAAWTVVCTLTYLAHVSYLSLLPRFDYTYNMVFNLTIGMLHNFLWLTYSLPSSLSFFRRFPGRAKSYRPQYCTKAAIFVALTTLATALEVLDFPPWARIIDAHSLWHLATVPIASFWYKFLVQDALDEGWRGQKL
ncbi:Per1-like protein [Obba rivulosa]|uniref:Post-GPI attachment to proteins factor 3 n=1 Tax=Obba rivulosa TaxID=1052685 RepID=A0A8E2DJV5_9APHY|nr:Per1-like protein [Obba rivulosa]